MVKSILRGVVEIIKNNGQVLDKKDLRLLSSQEGNFEFYNNGILTRSMPMTDPQFGQVMDTWNNR